MLHTLNQETGKFQVEQERVDEDYWRAEEMIYDLLYPIAKFVDIEHRTQDSIDKRYNVYAEVKTRGRAIAKLGFELQKSPLSLAEVDKKLESSTQNGVYTQWILVSGDAFNPANFNMKEGTLEAYLYQLHNKKLYYASPKENKIHLYKDNKSYSFNARDIRPLKFIFKSEISPRTSKECLLASMIIVKDVPRL